MIRPGRKQQTGSRMATKGSVLHPWPVERLIARHPEAEPGARNRARRDLCGVSGNGYPYRDMLALIYCFKCQRGKRYECRRRSRSVIQVWDIMVVRPVGM